jgi:Na+/proline symporter
MMTTMLLMAITPSGSAEGIVVSSLAAYEVHRTFINLETDDGKALLLSKVVNEVVIVISWVVFMVSLIVVVVSEVVIVV